MPVHLEKVVPWGRSAAEYRAMFALTPDDLSKKILDCGAGPSSFAAEMHAQGHNVIAADPLYAFAAEEIRNRVEQTRPGMMEQVRQDPTHFNWNWIKSPEMLEETRMSAMESFLADLPAGIRENRYRTTELPNLDFADNQFDLALCSHFLFLYSDQLSQDFHVSAVHDLKRVAREVRIFPILDLNGHRSRHLDAVTAEFKTQIIKVNYEFLRGANEMLMIN